MSATDRPPPPARLLPILFGHMVTRSISAVAELNVPDALKDGPRSAADLARAVGAHEAALGRAMRTFVSVGVFAEPEPGTYALTDLSELLRSDA